MAQEADRINTGIIQNFRDANTIFGGPVILTMDCVKVKNDRMTAVEKQLALSIERTMSNMTSCLWEEEKLHQQKLRHCRDTNCTEADWQKIYSEYYNAQEKCLQDCLKKIFDLIMAAQLEKIEITADYAQCCINWPGSCNPGGDGGVQGGAGAAGEF